jgi:very-short-patch-repair endonuclease
LAGLLHPITELRFVELIVLMGVEVAYVLVFGLARPERTERRAPEESHFDVFREAMKVEEPALALDAVERRVLFDGRLHDPTFADFACREQKLMVEVDGATHGSDEEVHHDERQTAFLGAQGYRVIRISNDDVYKCLPNVLDAILLALEKR